MKAARRPPPRRKGLVPNAEKNNVRLMRVAEVMGAWQRRVFIYIPAHPGETGFVAAYAGQRPLEIAEGEEPQAGDLVVSFPPLFDTEAEAQLTVEEFRQRHCVNADLAPAPLPWKRDLERADPPQRGRDPDGGLEALVEGPPTSDIRPLTEAEMRDAARGLLQTGNLFRRHVVRGALAGGQVPLGDDEEFPRAEFASSTTGTLLIRVWNYPGEQPKPRPATDADREQWASTFRSFIEACLGRGATSEHPDDEDAR